METLEGGFIARGSSAEDAIAGLSISHEIDKQTLADPQAGANATGGSHAQSSHRFTLSSRHSRSPGFRRVCRRPARIGAGPNRCATARDLPQAIAGPFSTKRSFSGPETSMSDRDFRDYAVAAARILLQNPEHENHQNTPARGWSHFFEWAETVGRPRN